MAQTPKNGIYITANLSVFTWDSLTICQIIKPKHSTVLNENMYNVVFLTVPCRRNMTERKGDRQYWSEENVDDRQEQGRKRRRKVAILV